MKRAIISTLRLGTEVYLTSQGKIYRLNSAGSRSDIFLIDKQGKEKRVDWNTSVYYEKEAETFTNLKEFLEL